MCNRIEVFVIGYSLIEPEPSVFGENFRRNNFSKKKRREKLAVKH